MKHILLIGTDFRRSSLKMRESVHFDDKVKPKAIKKITELGGIHECVILTTCNRVEIYLICDNPAATVKIVIKFLANYHNISEDAINKFMYAYRCDNALRHLFRVAAGLESKVIGETQILAQIKNAYELSKNSGGSGPFLNKLFQTALALGKEVRRKTTVTNGITSIGSAAAKLATQLVNPSRARLSIIGCGEMGSIVARNLIKNGTRHLRLSNRTKCRGKDLAKETNSVFVELTKIDELLRGSDLIITATSSGSLLITKKQLERALKNRPKLKVIDISTPRNVDPTATDLENLELYSIEDLNEIIDNNLEIRKSSINVVENYIENKLGFYKKWYGHKVN